jgi:hypothetical protein
VLDVDAGAFLEQVLAADRGIELTARQGRIGDGLGIGGLGWWACSHWTTIEMRIIRIVNSISGFVNKSCENRGSSPVARP